ncbi:uncharacterized protein [Amphiura filiformis]|uniref:uncharacterized protein isoform X1 n=1 Tax=Amphiura filiformis TaxID=82378 RepID=UPI003B21975F
MSMLNPGTSINFDGHVLEEQAEAELEKEDQRCQQELRDLLTTALPDDLLDDESSSLSSSLSPDKNSSPEPWQDDDEQHEQRRHQEQFPDWVNNLERLRNNLQHGLHHQTSTPQVGVNLPPLKTPAAYQEYDYFRELQMEMVFLCLLMEPT